MINLYTIFAIASWSKRKQCSISKSLKRLITREKIVSMGGKTGPKVEIMTVNRHQISLLILNEFERISYLLSPIIIREHTVFC